MIYSKIIDGSKYKRVHSREMWIQENCQRSYVYSYETLIGFVDWQNKIFYTWGYRRYSTTTSKQITQLCNECHLTRRDIGLYSEE